MWDATNPDAGPAKGPYTYGPRGGSGTGTRAKSSKTVSKTVQVCYGTATVEAVPVTQIQAAGGQAEVLLDKTAAVSMDVAEIQIGLAFGPVTAIEGVIYEKALFGPTGIGTQQVHDQYLGAVGFHPTYTLGNPATASTWSIYSGSDANWRAPLGHIALFRCGALGCPNGIASVGTMKGVIRGRFATHRNTEREEVLGSTWQIYDAHPADIIKDLVEDSVVGLGFPVDTVDVETGSDGSANSSYRRYCTAMGFWIALGVDAEASASDLITQVLTATNSVGYWDGPVFRVIPLGEVTVTGNSVTYTPVLNALRITDDELELDGDEPVKTTRTSWASSFNVVPIEWTQDTELRDAELITSEDMNTANASAYGIRRGPPVSLPCIRKLTHAQYISRILAGRSIYNRNAWEFRLNPRTNARVRVGDVLALSHEAMGLTNHLVRVTETEEASNGTLTVLATTWVTDATYILLEALMASPVYDLVAYAPDPIAGSGQYGRWAAAHTLYFGANFSGSKISAGTAATASTVLTVKKNGTSVGTLTFAAAGTIPTMACTAWSCAAGDIITIENQAAADATLSNVSITLAGTRDP